MHDSKQLYLFSFNSETTDFVLAKDAKHIKLGIPLKY